MPNEPEAPLQILRALVDVAILIGYGLVALGGAIAIAWGAVWLWRRLTDRKKV
jgi:hypothetical protein